MLTQMEDDESTKMIFKERLKKNLLSEHFFFYLKLLLKKKEILLLLNVKIRVNRNKIFKRGRGREAREFPLPLANCKLSTRYSSIPLKLFVYINK